MKTHLIVFPLSLLAMFLLLGSGCRRPPSSSSQEPIPFQAPQLMTEYIQNSGAADAKYKGRQLLVSGVVAAVRQSDMSIILKGANSLILNGVECSLVSNDENRSVISRAVVGNGIIVQGHNEGWDMGFVHLKQCVVKGGI